MLLAVEAVAAAWGGARVLGRLRGEDLSSESAIGLGGRGGRVEDISGEEEGVSLGHGIFGLLSDGSMPRQPRLRY